MGWQAEPACLKTAVNAKHVSHLKERCRLYGWSVVGRRLSKIEWLRPRGAGAKLASSRTTFPVRWGSGWRSRPSAADFVPHPSSSGTRWFVAPVFQFARE